MLRAACGIVVRIHEPGLLDLGAARLRSMFTRSMRMDAAYGTKIDVGGQFVRSTRQA